MFPSRLIRDIVRRRNGPRRIPVHLNLEQIFPEGTEVEVESVTDINQVRVNRVVRLGSVGSDADRTAVGPGVRLHGGRRGEADGRVLRAEC